MPSNSLSLLTGAQSAGDIVSILNTLITNIKSKSSGLIYSDGTSSATTTGTSEQTLKTYSLAASTLNANGQTLRITAAGTCAANGNNKTMSLYFGSEVITTPTAATNAKNWQLQLLVTRTAASTQRVAGIGIVDTTSVTPYNVTGAETDTAAITIKLTGTDGTSSAADITCTEFLIEIIQ